MALVGNRILETLFRPIGDINMLDVTPDGHCLSTVNRTARKYTNSQEQADGSDQES